MKEPTLKDNMREGVVERSIQLMRGAGVSDEKIKEKMMKSFSLDEEAIGKLLK